MLSFTKYFCILSICNLLLLHGITSAPTESDESVLEEKQHNGCAGGDCGGGGGGCHGGNCGGGGGGCHGGICGEGGGGCPGGNCGGGGGFHQCPSGQTWNGHYCVPSGGGRGK